MARNKKKGNDTKFYAVTKGRKIGIFTTWNEASEAVLGYHGAVHKSYDSIEKAIAAMRQAGVMCPSVYGITKDIDIENEEDEEEKEGRMEEDNTQEVENENLPSVSRQACTCKDEVDGRTLKCSECHRKIHFACTSLPPYQLCVFVGSSRLYTCEECAEAKYGSETVLEELYRQTPTRNDVNKEMTSSVKKMTLDDGEKIKFEARIDELKTMVCNLEKAVSTMTENIYSSFHELREQYTPKIDTEPQNTWATISEKDCQGPSKAFSQTRTDSQKRKQRVKKKPIKQKVVQDMRKENESITENTSLTTKNKLTSIPDTMSTLNSKSTTESDDETQHEELKSISDESDISSKSDEEENTDDSDRAEEISSNSLPYVLILHDSVLDGVDAKRLGDGYGLAVKKKNIYKLENYEKELGKIKSTPEVLLLHCGVNNLKNESADATSQKMVQVIQKIREDFGETQIVISQATPTSDDELEAKRKLYNALVFGELFKMKNVSFIEHNINPYNKTMFQDLIHPSVRGSSVMAANIGRHLHARCWTTTWKSGKRRPKPKFGKNFDKGKHNDEWRKKGPQAWFKKQENENQDGRKEQDRPDENCGELQDGGDEKTNWRYRTPQNMYRNRRKLTHGPFNHYGTNNNGHERYVQNEGRRQWRVRPALNEDRRQWRVRHEQYTDRRQWRTRPEDNEDRRPGRTRAEENEDRRPDGHWMTRAWNGNGNDSLYGHRHPRRNLQGWGTSWERNVGGMKNDWYDNFQNGEQKQSYWGYNQQNSGREDELTWRRQGYGPRRQRQHWGSYQRQRWTHED